MNETKTRKRRRVAVFLPAVLILCVGLLLTRRIDRDIPLGMPSRFDDFSFAVVDVRRIRDIDGKKPENGSFVVIRLGVRNGAKRVDYRLREETLVLEDLQGHRFPISEPGTIRLRQSGGALSGCAAPIPPGKSCTTDLVFDVPEDLSNTSLRFSFGTVPDILLRIFEGRTRFLLEGSDR